jgi:hypothetical protein
VLSSDLIWPRSVAIWLVFEENRASSCVRKRFLDKRALVRKEFKRHTSIEISTCSM